MHDRVEQIANTVTVFGRDLEDWIEAELIHLQRAAARALVIELVDREQRRLPRFANHLGDLAIAADQSFAAIHNEHKEIGVTDRSSAAFEHECVQRVFARTEHPACVGELEPRTFPLHGLRKDIPGGARNRRDDCAARLRDTVEQGRFAHVGTADQHDRRDGSGHVFGDC